MNSFVKSTVCLVTGFLFVGSNCLIAQSNAASSSPDRVILNLTATGTNSVAVSWRTDTLVEKGICEWQLSPQGPVASENTRQVVANTQQLVYTYSNEPAIHAKQHSCTLKDLAPGKSYIYRVGDGTNYSEWLEFSLPAEDQEAFSFLYFGDPQTSLKSQWSRVVRKAYQQVPESAFMLYAGDLINRAGKDREWQEWFEAGRFIFSSTPQLMTPGNHDYDDRNLDPHWRAQFELSKNGPKGLEETCFFIDYKNLRLISIDSAAGDELDDENGWEMQSQVAWLDSVLANTESEWIILTTHLPFYSPKASRDNASLRKHFQPLIEKYGVDLVLSGHDHSYGRGMASDSSNPLHQPVYVVSVSGPKMYEVGDKNWMKRKGSKVQLFQKITIAPGELNFEAYTANGDLFDHFQLRKVDGQTELLD